jgi:hypothetical protein
MSIETMQKNEIKELEEEFKKNVYEDELLLNKQSKNTQEPLTSKYLNRFKLFLIFYELHAVDK